MAFQTIDYAAIAPQPNPALTNLIPALVEGYQASQLPTQMQNLEQGQQLKNALSSLQINAFPQELANLTQSDKLKNALMQAQTQRLIQQANSPTGGQNPGGLIGQGLAVQQIVNKYGANSPQAQIAQQAYLTSLKSQQAKTALDFGLVAGMPRRYASPTGKLQMEEANEQQGLPPAYIPGISTSSPASNLGQSAPNQAIGSQIMPNQANLVTQNAQGGGQIAPILTQNVQQQNPQQQNLNQTQLALLKNISDPATRQKILYADNIEKTIGMINPDDLTQYAGAPGALELKKQQALAPFGLESPNYDRYQNALALTKLLAQHVRQFKGDSIVPSETAAWQNMTNPTSWSSNPKLAKQQYETLVANLQKEMPVFRSGLTNPQVYTANSSGTTSVSTPSYSDDDIAYTAKKYNMTPAQVRKMLENQ
jgi:hypothetical protein